jgi:peptidyl-prolyl cis-trans isomerase SurA
MKKSIYLFIAVFLSFSACKQSKTAKTSSTPTPIIATIGDQQVPTSEFAYVYNKNNANAEDAYTSESIKDYLKLYTNFKLKVREAEALGLDTAKAFQKELDGYKKQLAQPYFTEKSVTEKLTKEAYERMKEEVNASHILIKLNSDADPKDTLIAYNKIKEIREKALKGESFEQLAQQYSEDPSAKTNKGNLGYFTAFGTIYPFETVAYNTPVGSISNPVRTQFGYHLIKVNDKRKSQGQVKVAHIMIRSAEGQSTSDSIAAKQKIDEIYSRLQKGEEWNQLVSQFSEDANSKGKNGELMWFSAGKMIPSFEEAAFSLKQPGAITKPVLTPYGWHIIKLLERKELESFETLEPTIKSKVSKDRGEVNKKALMERLKKENNFTENQKALDAVFAAADTSLVTGTWNYKTDVKNNPVLFNIGQQKYTQEDFYKYVKAKQKAKKNISPSQYMRNLYKEYTDESLMAYEEKHLEEKYPDYKMLVKEYRDGILLFQLMDEKVWSKAIEDTAGLKKFFNNHRDKYKWDSRAHAKIFSVANPETLEKLKPELSKSKFPVKDYSAKEITFASGKFELSDEDKHKLETVVSEMNKNKAFIVELTSSADFTESTPVSIKRAKSAKDFLTAQGIDSSRISTVNKIGTKGKKEKDKVADRKLTINMFTTSVKELEKYYNANAPLTLQVSEGVYQKNENDVLNSVEWKVGNYTTTKDGRTVYVVISKIEEPRLKTFEEARGLTISDYQSFLEQEWIASLKKKYPVTINEAEIPKITKP